MHITSGLSPASGELLDSSFNLYGDGSEQCGTAYYAVDHEVPESSHTVEIEYIFEQPETYTHNDVQSTPKEKEPIKRKTSEKKDEIVKRVKPPEKIVEDQDLTNLTWLQNITNIMSVPQFPLPPMSPNPQTKTHPQNTRLQKFNQTVAKCQQDFEDNKNEYQNNCNKKPPYSYSTLICMAMRYNNDKMTLSAIYSWIRENFMFYRNADPTWQNSIRHNLSLNKVFVKVARSKQESGKGGYWKLDLAHLEGTKRISNRPHKKKKNQKKSDTEIPPTEESVAVANIPPMQPIQIVTDLDLSQTVQLHLPEYNYEVLDPLPSIIDGNIGANVIVEPVEPPPLIQEEDLTSLLLNPTDWDDLQLDMLDNYLDSCFK